MAGQPDDEDRGLRGSMRRALGGAIGAGADAIDATVGAVGHSVGGAALDVTGATAQQVIEELEPYLIEEAIPRIVAGIMPYLTDEVVPEVLERLQTHLVEVTIPDVVDGVTAHLVEVTVPEILSGATPRLADDLLPRLLEDLRPFLADELVPGLIQALLPQLTESIAPELVDALMPKLEAEVAPRLVDSLMPKIRRDVVPAILEDIVDDPSVRDLIREQSQGLFLDALESLRENMADIDNTIERTGRRLVGRKPRPEPESGVDVVLGATGGTAPPARATLSSLAEHRRAWQAMPIPPAPPGREFAHAGALTRLAAFGIDVTLAGWLVSQALLAVVGLLDSLLDPVPPAAVATLSVMAASFVPFYLGLSWWLTGRSAGFWLVGIRVCTPDGRNPGFLRALVRAWLDVVGFLVWLVTGILSLFDAKRRSWLDRIAHTEVRYVVPSNQQNRYIREALAERKRVWEEEQQG